MRTYGIFLAYSPNVRLRSEGLGRYLGAFIDAAVATDDVRLVIAAPSWLRKPLLEFFKEQQIPADKIAFAGPSKEPLLLRAMSWLDTRRKVIGSGRRAYARLISRAKNLRHMLRRPGSLAAGIRSFYGLIGFGILLALVGVAILPFLLLARIIIILARSVRWVTFRALRLGKRVVSARLPSKILNPDALLIRRLYNLMLEREIELVIKAANEARDVRAWYTSSAIWPSFNLLKAPKLACFPDLVFMGFPVGFAEPSYGALYYQDKTLKTVADGEHFVTYSRHVKDTVLVEQLAVPEHKVHVVPHAPQNLSHRVNISHTVDNEAISRAFCRGQVLNALGRAIGPTRGQRFTAVEFPFLFYASQFRPSKNVITLLRAYEHLLRRRLIGHKLVLTGNGDFPPVRDFVLERRLERDVLFVNNLTETQLASCYKLADLAVNPSLSEGGMPFTYTEAISVGTPVVMGDIEVTREILVDERVRALTLFDPYDWKAMADKIEWALSNRTELYAEQRRFYDDVLAKRTWRDVVAEHLAIMDDIARAPKGISQ